MINNQKCPACGRRRKYGHESRVDTELAYSPECKKYKLREDRQYFQKTFKLDRLMRKTIKIYRYIKRAKKK